MSSSAEMIARCQHIKGNDERCASPALRCQKFCYFHKQWRQKQLEMNANIHRQRGKLTLPTLESAESVKMARIKVKQLLGTKLVDHRTATQMLYVLQMAASNLKRMSC